MPYGTFLKNVPEFISGNLVKIDSKDLHMAPPSLLTKSLVALNNKFLEEESPVRLG